MATAPAAMRTTTSAFKSCCEMNIARDAASAPTMTATTVLTVNATSWAAIDRRRSTRNTTAPTDEADERDAARNQRQLDDVGRAHGSHR